MLRKMRSTYISNKNWGFFFKFHLFSVQLTEKETAVCVSIYWCYDFHGQVFSWHRLRSVLDFEVRLGSSSTSLVSLSLFTDGDAFASSICRRFTESILLSTCEVFPVPLAATHHLFHPVHNIGRAFHEGLCPLFSKHANCSQRVTVHGTRSQIESGLFPCSSASLWNYFVVRLSSEDSSPFPHQSVGTAKW